MENGYFYISQGEIGKCAYFLTDHKYRGESKQMFRPAYSYLLKNKFFLHRQQDLPDTDIPEQRFLSELLLNRSGTEDDPVRDPVSGKA